MTDLISPEHTRAVGSLVLGVSKLEGIITNLLARIHRDGHSLPRSLRVIISNSLTALIRY